MERKNGKEKWKRTKMVRNSSKEQKTETYNEWNLWWQLLLLLLLWWHHMLSWHLLLWHMSEWVLLWHSTEWNWEPLNWNFAWFS